MERYTASLSGSTSLLSAHLLLFGLVLFNTKFFVVHKIEPSRRLKKSALINFQMVFLIAGSSDFIFEYEGNRTWWPETKALI